MARSIQEMRTPHWLFEYLNKRFGPFGLDAAASPHNALCHRFYSKVGHQSDWASPTFCNPPFENFGDWIAHAYREWVSKRQIHSVLVGPVGCSQTWFHEYASRALILAPNKRINFDMPDGTPTKGAGRDTMIYCFGYGSAVEGSFRVKPLDVRTIIGA